MSNKNSNGGSGLLFMRVEQPRIFHDLLPILAGWLAGTVWKSLCSFPRFLLAKLKRRAALESDQCVICLAGHPDLHRLAQIIGRLPVGKLVKLHKVRDRLDGSFKTITSDLEYLIFELQLPIEFSRRGVMLHEPVCLCEHHAHIAKQAGAGKTNLRAHGGVRFTAERSDSDPVSPPL